MRGLKTFFTFFGVYILAVLGVRLLTFISNKVFDSLPDAIYLPTVGAATGYLALVIAADRALRVASNEPRTRKSIWIFFLIIGILTSLHGIVQLTIGIYLDLPLFDTEAAFPHWLMTIPNGLATILASIKVKRDKLD